MAAVIRYTGRVQVITQLLAWLDTLKIRLFQNDIALDPAVGTGQFTEGTFDGYPAGGVALNTWAAAFLNGANRGETDNDLVVFTQTGVGTTNNIYGYYVVDAAGEWVWGERKSAPVPVAMDAIGATYSIPPVFRDDQGAF